MKKLITIFCLLPCLVFAQANIRVKDFTWKGSGTNFYTTFHVSGGVTPSGPTNYWESSAVTGYTNGVVVISADSEYSGSVAWGPWRRLYSGNYMPWTPTVDQNPHYMQYDLGAGNSNVVGTIFSDNSPGRCWKDFTLDACEDGTSWVSVYTGQMVNVIAQSIHTGLIKYHRFWRISMTTYWGVNPYIYEFELSSCDFDGVPMTDNTHPSPYIASADTEYNSSYGAWAAFSRDQRYRYNSDNATAFPHWLQMYYGSNVCINGFNIVRSLYGYLPSDYSFQYSMDGTNFTSVYGGTLSNIAQQVVYFYCTNSAPYWRFYATNGWDGNVTMLADRLDFKHYRLKLYQGEGKATDMMTNWVSVVPEMTDASTPAPYVASANVGNPYFPFKSIDGGNMWNNILTLPSWIEVDLGATNTQAVQRYTLFAGWGGTYGMPKAWSLESSDNESTWVTQDVRSAQTDWVDYYWKTYDFTNTTPYRYWRINMTDRNGGDFMYVGRLFLSKQVISTIPPPPTGTNYVSIIPAMSDFTVPSPYVIFGRDDLGGWYAWHPWAAVDNWWIAFPSADDEMRINLSSTNKKAVVRYQIKVGGGGYEGQAPKDWTFCGANDPVNWNVLDTQVNQTGWGEEEVRTYTFKNTVPYQYYAWFFTAHNIVGDPYMYIYHMWMYDLE